MLHMSVLELHVRRHRRRKLDERMIEEGDPRLEGDDEVATVDRSFDRALDALLEVSDQVTHVTAEDLVAALSTQHDLPMACSELRDDELRERPGSGDRVVEVVDDVLNAIDEV